MKADNPLACFKGVSQAHAGKQASVNERLVDCWSFKRQHGTALKGLCFYDLLICGFRLGFISCQTCYILAARLISLNQIVPYQRKQTAQSYRWHCSRLSSWFTCRAIGTLAIALSKWHYCYFEATPCCQALLIENHVSYQLKRIDLLIWFPRVIIQK